MESITHSQPRYAVVSSYAGYCSWQGSDKDYAMCLVHTVAADADQDQGEADDTPTWMVLFVYGKPGALRGGDPGPLLTRTAAEKEYGRKVKEKTGPHHYTPLPGLDFAPYVRYFKVPLALSDAAPSPATADAGIGRAGAAAGRPAADARYAGCSVTDITLERFWLCAESSRYGTEEKGDGERCPIASARQTLTAYNRSGVALYSLPKAARSLLLLSELPFLVDGEKMVNSAQKGHYILFDLLEWQGEDIRGWPYQRRNGTLQQAMHAAGLIKEICPTPTIQQAYENSTVRGLALLTPVGGRENVQQLVAAIQQQGGEGMVVRDLDAPYLASNGAFKYKFIADLDAVVIGLKPGAGGGSLELGLRRPTDNAVLATGHVRAGLSPADMGWFAAQLAQGRLVVIRVRYRRKRTIGITLVEPSTSSEWVRSDKSAWDCTTEQWPEEKAALVAQAPALSGISFEDPGRSIPPGLSASQHGL